MLRIQNFQRITQVHKLLFHSDPKNAAHLFKIPPGVHAHFSCALSQRSVDTHNAVMTLLQFHTQLKLGFDLDVSISCCSHSTSAQLRQYGDKLVLNATT